MKKGQIGLGSIDYHSQGEANTIADADIVVESQQMMNGRKSGSRKSSNRMPRVNRSGGIIQQQKYDKEANQESPGLDAKDDIVNYSPMNGMDDADQTIFEAEQAGSSQELIQMQESAGLLAQNQGRPKSRAAVGRIGASSDLAHELEAQMNRQLQELGVAEQEYQDKKQEELT